ncbi:MAG: pseudouridine synthase [Desulfovibrio sp.]|jgi:23S rRNA pseudouridine1911/1915/1917 synthase|nr:pseudouridine synthase [Desulfovibrio sp.]
MLYIVSSELADLRLDAALSRLVPQTGLHGSRRVIAAGLALRNGRVEKASCRLRVGDRIEIAEREWAERISALPPRFLSRQGEYVFIDKAAGLHCVRLAGNAVPSLEGFLPDIIPAERGKARLLQRLDYETSGIVCAALSDGAVQAFRAAERAGRCEKRYITLLTGELREPAVVRLALDTASRRKSRLCDPTDDTTRWTEFWPLHRSRGLTLAACRIRRGARHQIRVHAAALGHSLRGDGLYGSSAGCQPLGGSAFESLPIDLELKNSASAAQESETPSSPSFFLHHGALFFPGGSCSLMPPWPLREDIIPCVRQFLEMLKRSNFEKVAPLCPDDTGDGATDYGRHASSCQPSRPQ